MYIVSKVALNNFKCFTTSIEPNEVELRPLTLFYGYNNAGKSAFLRGICMVLNSLSDEAHRAARGRCAGLFFGNGA